MCVFQDFRFRRSEVGLICTKEWLDDLHLGTVASGIYVQHNKDQSWGIPTNWYQFVLKTGLHQ